jgi:hypothetical protein
MFSIQYLYHPFSVITSTIWFLGQKGVLLKHPGDARFELQIDNIRMGNRGYNLWLWYFL